MTCRELIEFMDDYESGTQPAEVRAEFERHLKVCSHCRDYLKTYRDTLVLTRASFSDPGNPLPNDVPEDFIRAVIAARQRGGA